MQSIEPEKRVKVFISYAHADQELHKKLKEHLSALKRSGKIIIWQDQEIPAGANWKDQINTHLNEADLILLLVSASFIDSEYCWNKEVQRALERRKTGTAEVVPIILKPAIWKDTPLGQLQVLPTDAKPVTQWKDPYAAFEDVARGIRKIVKDLRIPSREDPQAYEEEALLERRKTALVVGVNNTRRSSLLPDLEDAENDAYAVALTLQTPACNFTCLQTALFELGKDKTFKVIFYRPQQMLTVPTNSADIQMHQPIEIFCCAAEADQPFLERLRTELASQQQEGVIKLWDESQIPAGEIADKEIRQHLDSARVFVLLISADFLADGYCNRVTKAALERHRRGKAKAIPVIVRPAYWQGVSILKSMQVLPRNSLPISSQPDPGEALGEVVREIRAITEQLGTASVGSDSEIEYELYEGVAPSTGDLPGASQGQIASSTGNVPRASSERIAPPTRDLPDPDHIPSDRPRPNSPVTVGTILKLQVTRHWSLTIIGVLILLSGVLGGLYLLTGHMGSPPPSTELYISHGQNGDIYIYPTDKSTFFIARRSDFSPPIDLKKITLHTRLDVLAHPDTITVNATIGGTIHPQAHVIEQLKLQDQNSTQVTTYTASDYNASGYYESGWRPVAIVLTNHGPADRLCSPFCGA